MRILITGHDTFENKGCQALIVTTTRLLHDAFVGAEFRVFSWDPEYDAPGFPHRDIPCRFVRHRFTTGEFSLRNRVWLTLARGLGLKTDKGLVVPRYFWDALAWADLVVVSGGDILADYGAEAVRHYLFPVAVAESLGKPVYVFAQSISKYESPSIERFARFYLDRVQLITVRERLSYEYLREMGVRARLEETADPAFTLVPAAGDVVDEIVRREGLTVDRSPTIGVSISETAVHWGKAERATVLGALVGGIDELAGRIPGVRFVFVPHVISKSVPSQDDRVIGREIAGQLKDRSVAQLIEGDYSCQELKGIIGRLDLFVGARTHATIAAMSQGVPTIALAYSRKAYGIMSQVMGDRRALLDVRSLSAGELADSVEALLNEREAVSREMASRLPSIVAAARRNGSLAAEVVRPAAIGPRVATAQEG